MTNQDRRSKSARLTRRQFLQVMGAATTAGLLAASCQSAPPATPTSPPTSTPLPTITPAPTETPLVRPTGEIVATSTSSAAWKPPGQVVIRQVKTYDRKLIRSQLQRIFESMGGIWDLVPLGAKIAIKVNLTGGVTAYNMSGVPAGESIATHPEVVGALTELLIDAGAGQIYIVEAVSEWDSYIQWGYEAMARPLNATLIDLNKPDPYPDFATVSVGPGWQIYENFTFNRILEEVDTFISVSKMKCHIECGVTHTMKNLVGLVPSKLYQVSPSDNHRTSFHVDSQTRLPRTVIDLNMARPIHLSIIDAIKTIEGGEGTWAAGVRQISPGLILVGRSPLATDAVATAVMGFDPTAEYPNTPFTRADNHLNLAYRAGWGTNILEEIEVMGPTIEEVRTPFQPATGYR